jgi:hypothetical protein
MNETMANPVCGIKKHLPAVGATILGSPSVFKSPGNQVPALKSNNAAGDDGWFEVVHRGAIMVEPGGARKEEWRRTG